MRALLCGEERIYVVMTPKNYDRPLYWYRKVDRHSDPGMEVLAEDFCKLAAMWLGIPKPPVVYWFEEAEVRQASEAWQTYPARRPRASEDPLLDGCEYFRWSGPSNCAFAGYTHRDSPLGIMVNVGRRGEELLHTIAHECFHIYQDLVHGSGWRKEARADVEGEASAFVDSKTDEIRAFLESRKRTRSRPQ